MLELKKSNNYSERQGPVVLMILDGYGLGKYEEGDACKAASTPCLDSLFKNYPWTKLNAHGTAVGLPSDADMGNSEVGHNAMGCGRVFAQGAKLVGDSIEKGAMFEGNTWKEVISNVEKNDSTLHFLGLFSDGNVHSHIDHLKAMIDRAKSEGIKKVRVHVLLDGRDVPETSALLYVEPFENYLAEINAEGFDYRIASGGGRQVITMDRYDANWDMVRLGWDVHVKGKGDMYPNATEAIKDLRDKTGKIDQDLPPFVISDDSKTPIGPVVDGDSIVFFNFRGDRSLEITAAFEKEDFDKFDRGPKLDVCYAGMMEYDGDLHVPKKYLVSPPAIDRTLGEYLCDAGITQLAISETQKYGHVTYFFNGNKSGYFNEELEDYVEVLSDVVPFEQRPWMKCAEITDKVVEAVENNKYKFIRLNYPNGDMVGLTGNMHAVTTSLAALDICVERVLEAIKKANGVLIITADHGNADDMYEHDKKSGSVKCDENGEPSRKTSHSLNPVPAIVVDMAENKEYKSELKDGLGISSIPATVMNFLGFDAPEEYDQSILVTK
jgi:2,3-bisphosphoglycerate-independent phosphoglycerate mutase